MKITHNKVGQNLSIHDTGKSEKAEGANGAKASGGSAAAAGLQGLAGLEASKVEISPRAQDVAKAKQIANSTPDVDEAKVARLQKLIDEGKYKIDASDIADKMIADQQSWE